MTASARISIGLQGVAGALQDVLSELAGEPVHFTLMVFADKTTQYISTLEREQSAEFIHEMLRRWAQNLPDVPAHQVN